MAVQLNAYLSFNGEARQAMEFYQSIFSGELTMSTFNEFGSNDDSADGNNIMHAMLVGDNGLTFMASDTPSGMEFKPGTNFNMSLSGDDEQTLSSYFSQLAEGGQTTMPISDSPWGDKFGMLTDKFGIGWMVNITKPAAAAE